MNVVQRNYDMNNTTTWSIDECLYFVVPGRAQQRGSKNPFINRKTGKLFVTDDNPKSKDWMRGVSESAYRVLPRDWTPASGPLRLRVKFYFARPASHFGSGRNARTLKASAPMFHTQTPDLSKLIRALEDAMTGIVYVDDKQICEYDEPQKLWTVGVEKTEVTVTWL